MMVTLDEQATASLAPYFFVLPEDLFVGFDETSLAIVVTSADGSPLPSWLTFDELAKALAGTPPVEASLTHLDLLVSISDANMNCDIDFGLDINDPSVTLYVEEGSKATLEPIYLEGHSDAEVAFVMTGTRGLLSNGLDGSMNYDTNGLYNLLAEGAKGYDAFVLRVEANGVTREWKYHVEVAGLNDAPVVNRTIDNQFIPARSEFSLAIPEDAFFDFDVGDTLMLSATQADGAALPTWLIYDSATRTLSGTPQIALSHTHVDIKITATDGFETAETIFGLDIGDPQLALEINEGGVLRLPLGYQEGDPNSELTLQADDALGAVTLNADGSIDYSPNGQFEFLGRNEASVDTFGLIAIANGIMRKWTYLVSIAGENDVPTPSGTVNNLLDQHIAFFSYELPDGLISDVDIGDSVNLSVASADGSPLPAWMAFDSTTRILSGSAPTAVANSRLDLKLTGSDGLASADVPFGIEFGSVLGDQFSPALSPYTLTFLDVLFSDLSGHDVSVTITQLDGSPLPDWLTFDSFTRELSGTPPLNYSDRQLQMLATANDGTAVQTINFGFNVGSPVITLEMGEDDAAILDLPFVNGDPDAMVTALTDMAVGSVFIDEEGTVRYSTNGQFEALSEGAYGRDNFQMQVVSNGESYIFNYIVDITGANDAPVATDVLTDLNVGAGKAVSYTIPNTLFLDVDSSDTLTYTATLDDGSPLPEWLILDSATGVFSGTAPAGAPLELPLSVHASDGMEEVSRPFLVHVSDGPEIKNTFDQVTTLEDQFFTFTVPADTFSSPTGSPLSYTAIGAGGNPLPDWLVFDSLTATFSGTPDQDYEGARKFQVIASDGLKSTSLKFTLTVEGTPDAPSEICLTTDWIQEFSSPGAVVGVFSTTDPDNHNSFTYTLLDDADGAFSIADNTLVVSGALVSYVGGGTKDIVVRVTASDGLSYDKAFTIDIKSPDQAEIFSDVEPQSYLWVATDGVDQEGGGTAEAPFASIQYALDHCTPGTAIMVKSGTYAEAIRFNLSGTTDAPIWLISADGVGAAIIEPPAVAEITAISGQGLQNAIIQGFEIKGSDTIGTNGFNLVSKNNGASGTFEDGYGGTPVANVLIKDNIITNWGIDSIHLSQAFNVQILGNTISGAHEQGIDIISARRIVIANNNVDNITSKPEWKGADGRDYTGDSGITIKGGVSDALILNNYVGDTQGFGIKIGSPTSIRYIPIVPGEDSDGAHYIRYDASNVLVEGNISTESGAGGMLITGSQNIVVRENLIGYTRLGVIDRDPTGAPYGLTEQYLPFATDVPSRDILFDRNVYTSSALHNGGASTYTDRDNVVYNSNADYSAGDYAWFEGISTSWISSRQLIAGSGNSDILYGTAGSDFIQGQSGADVMYGREGTDFYFVDNVGDVVIEYVNEGTETLVLSSRVNNYRLPEPLTNPGGYVENVVVNHKRDTVVFGNSLDNNILGGVGDDKLVGLAGSDTLYGGIGNDSINGGDDADRLYGGQGEDYLVGGGGDDTLEGGADRDIMKGGSGDDIIISYDADARVDGGAGIDKAYLDRSTSVELVNLDISYFGNGDAGSDDTRSVTLADGTRILNIEVLALSSGVANDTITGGYYDDDIYGGGGDDVVNGINGNDKLWGGTGLDRISGGEGEDFIDGGLDADILRGGAGNDEIVSNEADLILDGGEGSDLLIIDREDTPLDYYLNIADMVVDPLQYQVFADGTAIRGFERVDFRGGDGNDTIYGGDLNDKIHGAQGNDIIYGGGGSDKLTGANGDDEIHGGAGSDLIIGGHGIDDLWGDGGEDKFQIKPGTIDGDTIYDFEGVGKTSGDFLEFLNYGAGAALTYDTTTQLWTITSADGSLFDSFTIVGVTSLAVYDYSID
ncbi:putative Ig domain-containing protein [Sphingobium sp. AS12]|uniref:putative Ig domain-containing protein n=1 Tax=Sphingobium sp. AS12 TaxID=2849495 RepID=UPI001C313305|nr:putative Ig domain-containing protein [Sphingobium sp. AS12]MBV2149734.1 putative Ig domain-containing protein [Sphingobium sp. AS12]